MLVYYRIKMVIDGDKGKTQGDCYGIYLGEIDNGWGILVVDPHGLEG